MAAGLIMVGWRGRVNPDGSYLNVTLTDILVDPPWDVLVVDGDVPPQPRRLLVSVGSSSHSRLATEIAVRIARVGPAENPEEAPRVTILRAIAPVNAV